MDQNVAPTFTIGTLARAAGVGVETIRYYQRRGLLAEPAPARGAYRAYGTAELARLRAIRRAQQLGFSLEEIDGLLALNADTDRERARAAAQAKIGLIEARIRQLQEMRDALAELVQCCRHSDAATPCPILRALSGDHVSAAAAGSQADNTAPQSATEGGRVVQAEQAEAEHEQAGSQAHLAAAGERAELQEQHPRQQQVGQRAQAERQHQPGTARA